MDISENVACLLTAKVAGCLPHRCPQPSSYLDVSDADRLAAALIFANTAVLSSCTAVVRSDSNLSY